MLEVQLACGGIIDIAGNHRLPLDLAISRRLLPDDIRERIEDSERNTRGYIDVNSADNLTYA